MRRPWSVKVELTSSKKLLSESVCKSRQTSGFLKGEAGTARGSAVFALRGGHSVLRSSSSMLSMIV